MTVQICLNWISVQFDHKIVVGTNLSKRLSRICIHVYFPEIFDETYKVARFSEILSNCCIDANLSEVDPKNWVSAKFSKFFSEFCVVANYSSVRPEICIVATKSEMVPKNYVGARSSETSERFFGGWDLHGRLKRSTPYQG